jgi:arylsulfatase A-like enzyme
VTDEWRDAAVSELDYSFRRAGLDLQVPADKARAWMIRSKKWKYVFYEGFRPQLFDLENDPRELVDRGADPALASVRAEYDERLSNGRATGARASRCPTKTSPSAPTLQAPRHHLRRVVAAIIH